MGLLRSPKDRDNNPNRPNKPLLIGAATLAAAVAVGAVVVLWPGGGEKHLTAYFERATGVYPGSAVRVLGVKVGAVTKVTPKGSVVEVQMAYESDRKVPADAQAVIIIPSLVADRYVQLAPVYKSGPVMGDGATLVKGRTVSPIEIDDANAAVSELAKALGPQGANAEGSLNRLLTVGAKSLQGQGDSFKQTLKDLSSVTSVLAENRGNTTQTIKNLDTLTRALAESDQHVRSFNQSLASVSAQLNGEKTELHLALQGLTTALEQVTAFVRKNKKSVATNVHGLAQITGLLVKEKRALELFLEKGATGLQNAVQTYNGQAGTTDSRLNLLQSDNLAMWLCSLTYSLGAPPKQCETLLKPLNALGIPLSNTGVNGDLLVSLISHYDVVPPPPDAYPGGKPAAAKSTKAQAAQKPAPGGQDQIIQPPAGPPHK